MRWTRSSVKQLKRESIQLTESERLHSQRHQSESYGLGSGYPICWKFPGLRDIINFFEGLRGHVAQLAGLDM